MKNSTASPKAPPTAGFQSPARLTLGLGNFFTIGPSISLPIFNGGRIRSNIKAQDARLDQSILLYEDTLRRSLEEVENSLMSYERKREQHAQLEEAVASNRRSVELSRIVCCRPLGFSLCIGSAERALREREPSGPKARQQWRSIWWPYTRCWDAVGEAQDCERA